MVNEEQQEYRATGTEFKHEDTTQVMRIRFIAGNRFPIYPTEGHKFVAKIGDADGNYTGDYPVSVSGSSFEVKSSDLKGLDSGNYRLEVWESYVDSEGNTQVGIFPSPQAFVSFTINKNIEDTAWDLVKDISFQDLVNTAVTAAGQNIVVIATNTLPAGSQASVTQKYENGKNEFTFNIPEGQQGPVGPAPTLHVTKVTTMPNGEQPSFTATSVGNGNYNIEIGLPKGDKGDTGSRGYSFWAMKVTAGGNVSGRYITDLYNASASNLPEVNDLVVQPDGNVYQVTGVSGSTFNLGSALFSINDQAEYQALNDKFNNMKIGTRNLLHHSDTFDGWNIGNSVTITSDKYLNGIIAVLGNTGLDSSQVESNLDGPYDNQPVTWTVWAKADNTGDRLHTELWGSGGATDQPLTNNWQIYQFTGQRNMNGSSFYLWGCQGNKGNIYVALPFAVVGNMIGTWEPNPEDTTTAIQALQQQVYQLEQKINQSTQPASSASQSTQSATNPATR